MLVLEFERGERIQVSQSWQIDELLDELDSETNSFFILHRDENTYLQGATMSNGYVVEVRLGSESEHYRSKKNDTGQSIKLDEVKKLARGFFEGSLSIAEPPWQSVDLSKEQPAFSPDERGYYFDLYGDTWEARVRWWNERFDQFRWQVTKVILAVLVCALAFELISKLFST